jgi:nucleoside-diphosphate-sugar epimerase
LELSGIRSHVYTKGGEKMRVLITGAAGFIGYHLAKRIINDPDVEMVYLIDNFVRGRADELYRALCSHNKARHLTLDLSDPQQVGNLPSDVDYIFHLAALNGTQNFYERPVDVIRCSFISTWYLLSKYVQRGCRVKVIFASSSEVYASTINKFSWPVPTKEDVPLCIDDIFNPRWSYAASKILDEVFLACASKQCGIKFVILRYHNIYGPRMGDKHVIPDFIERMRQGELVLYGYNNTRTFMYIDDAVEATILLAKTPAAENEIVNVGGSTEVTMLELAQILMRLANVQGEIKLRPAPPGSVLRRVPNTEKLRRLTGFEEKWSLEEGLLETLRYYWPEAVKREV